MNINHVIPVFGRLRWRSARVLAAVLFIGLLLSTVALASTAQSYAISWWTIDNGGVILSVGGSYGLGGAIGQPDTGAMSGGGFMLEGGFWQGGVTGTQHRIYLPVVLR
jgi:hypothetical protein